MLIKFVAAKRVAATFVAARILPENSCFQHPPIKLEQKVALCGANEIGRPLPGKMLLHDKLPTFHFRLHFSLCALRLQSTAKLVSHFKHSLLILGPTLSLYS
jgi:hypothetical protein